MLFLWVGILVASLIALVKSSDWFTLSAEHIGRAFGLSGFIVGATIISIGSSMPELATGVITTLQNDPSTATFAIDNIVGSNIANILLICGVLAIFCKNLKIKSLLIDVDLPFLFIATGLFFLFVYDGSLALFEGIILLGLLILFITYTIKGDHVKESTDECADPVKRLHWYTWVILIASAVGIYFSADYTITSVIKVAEILNIAPSIVTMLAVAIGTSLPELIVSVRAAQKGKPSIAIGNIFGSNIFNVLAVAGIPALIGTLTVSPTVLSIGLPFLGVATFAFIFALHDDQLRRWEGLALFFIYIAFVGKIIGVI
jgi:cation:H+ antiporter